MLHVSRAAFHLAVAAIAFGAEVREGTAVARYFAFFVVACAFTVGAVGIVESHHHVSSPAPQVVAYQSAH
jgi:hypothetical protein